MKNEQIQGEFGVRKPLKPDLSKASSLRVCLRMNTRLNALERKLSCYAKRIQILEKRK
jgi:hypothetical protein